MTDQWYLASSPEFDPFVWVSAPIEPMPVLPVRDDSWIVTSAGSVTWTERLRVDPTPFYLFKLVSP